MVKKLVAIITLLLFSTAGIGGCQRKAHVSEDVINTESALANGRLNIIAYVNARKTFSIYQQIYGQAAPETLLVGNDNKDVLIALLRGPANLEENLEHFWFTAHNLENQEDVAGTIVLSGTFSKKAILDSLKGFYNLQSHEDNIYAVTKKKGMSDDKGACPQKKEETEKQKQKTHYIFLGTQQIIMTDNLDHGVYLQGRLNTETLANQDMARWNAYRQDKIASLMVMSAQDASKSIGGISGLLARQAATQNEQLTGLLAGLGLNPLRWSVSVNANLSLMSQDHGWRQELAGKMRTKLHKLKNDSRQVSPSLANLLAQIHVSNQSNTLAIDMTLDSDILENIEQIVLDVFSQVFSFSVSDEEKNAQEQLQQNPKDYAENAVFVNLPDIKPESYEMPLFTQGPFSIELQKIDTHEDGFLEVSLQGKVALPKGKSQFGEDRSGELALVINSISNAAGEDLQRDERCDDSIKMFVTSLNHEPETTTSLFQDKAFLTKHVRLRKDVKFQDIQGARGHLRFTSPTKVHKFPIRMQSGETIEHKGMRFYLSKAGDSNVSYQLSGDKKRFLELRALNRDGRPLRETWSMSTEFGDKRVNQSYKGRIHALELFVIDEVSEHQVAFNISPLLVLAPPKAQNPPPPYPFARLIDPADWTIYEELDRKTKAGDPDHWQKLASEDHWNWDNSHFIGKKYWDGLAMFVKHKIEENWISHPTAHVYFPMLPSLPSVLSALSYQIETPKAEEGPDTHYINIHYPYFITSTESHEFPAKHHLAGKPITAQEIYLKTGLKKGERFDHLKGKVIVRLPTQMSSEKFSLNELWVGQKTQNMIVSLTGIQSGSFVAGYSFKIEGNIEKLVNLYGLDSAGNRIKASTTNFQSDGYWTMTIPFGKNLEKIELVYATDQHIIEYPFSLKAEYSNAARHGSR